MPNIATPESASSFVGLAVVWGLLVYILIAILEARANERGEPLPSWKKAALSFGLALAPFLLFIGFYLYQHGLDSAEIYANNALEKGLASYGTASGSHSGQKVVGAGVNAVKSKLAGKKSVPAATAPQPTEDPKA